MKESFINLWGVVKSFAASYFFHKPQIVMDYPSWFSQYPECTIYRYRTSYFCVNESREIIASSVSPKDQQYTEKYREKFNNDEIYTLTHTLCKYHVDLRGTKDYMSLDSKRKWIDENLTGLWEENGSMGLYYYFEDEQDYLKFLFRYS